MEAKGAGKAQATGCDPTPDYVLMYLMEVIFVSYFAEPKKKEEKKHKLIGLQSLYAPSAVKPHAKLPNRFAKTGTCIAFTLLSFSVGRSSPREEQKCAHTPEM